MIFQVDGENFCNPSAPIPRRACADHQTGRCLSDQRLHVFRSEPKCPKVIV